MTREFLRVVCAFTDAALFFISAIGGLNLVFSVHIAPSSFNILVGVTLILLAFLLVLSFYGLLTRAHWVRRMRHAAYGWAGLIVIVMLVWQGTGDLATRDITLFLTIVVFLAANLVLTRWIPLSQIGSDRS